MHITFFSFFSFFFNMKSSVPNTEILSSYGLVLVLGGEWLFGRVREGKLRLME